MPSDGIPSESLLRNQVETIIFNALGVSKCEGQFATLRNSMVYALLVVHRAAAPSPVAAEGVAKAKLIAKLKELARSLDEEHAHCEADGLLIEFIGDIEIADAYSAIGKWYA